MIGVIVLGFVIGAGLSLAGKHGTTSTQVAVDASPSPSASPEPTPTDVPTLAPLATSHPSATSSATSSATQSPEPTPSPRATATPTRAASPEATPSKSPPTASPIASPIPSPTHAHVVAALASPTPHPVATAVVATSTPTAAAVATPTAGTTIDADSEFGRLSASVVRQYLRALARGDTESAYGAFGAAPGSPNVSFPERPVMSANAQIGLIQARGSSESQTVNVTITSDAGTYYGTYNVRRSQTGAAIITAHSINKG
jgi:hypothetical protein